MSTEPALRVDGARQLRSAIRRAGDELTEFTASNRAVAQIIAQAGTAGAPRRTGALAAAIRPGATQGQAVVSAAVPYAQAIHWGWPRRGIAAQPWLSTAAQRTEPGWLPIYMARVETIVDRIERSTP